MTLYHVTQHADLQLRDFPMFAVDDLGKARAFIDNYWDNSRQQFIYELELNEIRIVKADVDDMLIVDLVSNPDQDELIDIASRLQDEYGEFDAIQYSDYDPEDDQKDYDGCFLIMHPEKTVKHIKKVEFKEKHTLQERRTTMTFNEYLSLTSNRKHYIKNKLLCESNEEDDVISKKSLVEFGESLIKASKKYAKDMTTQVLMKLADLVNIDPKKLSENKTVQKIAKTLEEMFTPDMEDNLTPLVASYYSGTDVYICLYMKTKKGILKKLAGLLPGGQITKFFLVPFKVNGKKIQLDMSGNAMTQMCMTMFLSDIDCDVVWPMKMKSNWFTKALDFICPSLVDLLSLVTFGGASVAGRLAKVGVKKGAKLGAKVGKTLTKAATRAGAKVGGKTGAKIAKNLAKDGIEKIGKKAGKTLSKMQKKLGKSSTEKAFDKVVKKLPKGMQKKAKKIADASGSSRRLKSMLRRKDDTEEKS